MRIILLLLMFTLGVFSSCNKPQTTTEKELAIKKRVKKAATSHADNMTILQGFYWYIKDPVNENAHFTKQPEPESNLFQYIAEKKAEEIYQDGFTHVWLPPTGKAFGDKKTDGTRKYNVGYAVYDHYDLGEFDQQSRTRTKYGTKKDLIGAVNALHKRKVKVIADIVMNQMLGADKKEKVKFKKAYVVKNNRVEKKLNDGVVDAYVNFDFKNREDKQPRGTKHSAFKWTKEHFDGFEYFGTYYLFDGKTVDKVNNYEDLPGDSEYQNLRSDIILGMDLDLENKAVQDEMINWTKWLVKEVGFDGFRVDAIKHLHTPFVKKWADEVTAYMNKIGKGEKMLMFGENWDGWNDRLSAYLTGEPDGKSINFNKDKKNYSGIAKSMALFDVPLHYDFQKIAGENPEKMDITELPSRGILAKHPHHTITFVDNHDTVPTEMLASYIPIHTKLQAYTFILLNESGTPTVYYRDIYKGNFTSKYTNDNFKYLSDNIKKLIEIRHRYAYGKGTYFAKTKGILGYKRDGDKKHKNSGVIYLIKQHGRSADSLSIPTNGKWKLAGGKGRVKGNKFSLSKDSMFAVWVRDN